MAFHELLRDKSFFKLCSCIEPAAFCFRPGPIIVPLAGKILLKCFGWTCGFRLWVSSGKTRSMNEFAADDKDSLHLLVGPTASVESFQFLKRIHSSSNNNNSFRSS